VIWYSGCALAL